MRRGFWPAASAAAMLAVAMTGPARAGAVDTFAGTGTFADTSPVLNNAVYFVGAFQTSPFSFTGGVGYTYTDPLGVTGYDLNLAPKTQSDSVQVALDFTLPNAQSSSIGGTGTLTDKFHLAGLYYSDTGTIKWSSNTSTVDFTDGSKLQIDVPNFVFKGVDGYAQDAQNVTMTVLAVPEPAALALLGTALVGFGLARGRRRIA